jgi:hypothetical protein
MTTYDHQAVETAKKAYHDAQVEFADLDARLIDADATAGELRTRHAQAAIRVNATRQALVDARSPQPPSEQAGQVISIAGRAGPSSAAEAFDRAADRVNEALELRRSGDLATAEV